MFATVEFSRDNCTNSQFIVLIHKICLLIVFFITPARSIWLYLGTDSHNAISFEVLDLLIFSSKFQIAAKGDWSLKDEFAILSSSTESKSYLCNIHTQ